MLATAEPKAADSLHSDAENSLRQRAKDLLELEIEFIDNASFRKAAVRKEILTTEISCDAA